jgi:chorismate dehydratase
MSVRLGAVHYLNVRPLVYRLDRDPHFALQFDAPSRCADLLQAGDIDLGMIPSIEFARAVDYRIVPGLAIGSRGPVASVAMFTKVPIDRIRTIAADTSSRTSVGLLRVLCARRFHIAPEFQPMAPDPATMLARADAALIIGDPALFLDHEAMGVAKIDLGAEWGEMTGLPFVWAFWAGRRGAIDRDGIERLQRARDAGVGHTDEIGDAYCAGDPPRMAVARKYLRDNMQYGLGEAERRALETYYGYAAELGLVDAPRRPEFY